MTATIVSIPDTRPLCKTGLPRKGWANVGIVDNGQDNLQLCPWCERQHYRYGHIMQHPEVDGEIEVGCDCAENISDTYVDAAGAQRRFVAKAAKAGREAAEAEQAARGRQVRIEAARAEIELMRQVFAGNNEALMSAVFNAVWCPTQFGVSCHLLGFKVEVVRSKFDNGTYQVQVGKYPLITKSEWVRSEQVPEAIRSCLRSKWVKP